LKARDFSTANLFMMMVVPISNRSSCSILFRIRLFSLFLFHGASLLILNHLKFRKWPFSTADGHCER